LVDCVRAFFWRDLGRQPPHTPADTRVPPSPYPGIIWLTRGTAQLVECAGAATAAAMPAITLSGAHRHPYHSVSSLDGDSFCLAFQPGALGLLTGQDLAPLTDRVTDATTWLPAAWHHFLAAVHAAPDHGVRQALCVDFLTPRWAVVADRHAAWLQVLHQAWQRGARQALASALDWTPRHLQRRTRQLAGLRPGEIERMLRAEHALLAMRDGNAGALDAALRHGYADQAHFSREARALFEKPPAALKAHTRRPGDDADWLLRRS
ncbi:helix-turn-helix domain-containing protein, partial [Acidovorax sp. HMWF018]|uniref:helix-turn-helix transcriptional regulator n=1 Tax=Acidovorax sp. HMWF018 TaxID=2056855 RepID=UPI0035149BDF